jgi:histidyl-tRNA synthetase
MFDTGARSMKAQMKEANRESATWCIIAGDTELETGNFVFRNMAESSEEMLPLSQIVERLVDQK